MSTLKGFVASLLALVVATTAAAAPYPDKPVRLIVPASAGGASDILARILGDELAKRLGQQVVIEPRPGAAGNVATAAAARSEPDGYTLLFGETGALAVNPSLYAKTGFDPINDFAPIGLVASFPFVLVAHPSVPASNVRELAAYLKLQPEGLHFASPGVGTPQHLGAELFKKLTGVALTHVPYRGGGPAVTDLLGGQVKLGFLGLPPLVSHIKSGTLKAFGVSSRSRAAAAPDISTMEEAGLSGYDSGVWYGVLAPKATPQDIVDRLGSDIRAIVAQPEFKRRLTEQGANTLTSTPSEFQALIRSENVKWAEIVKSSGVKID